MIEKSRFINQLLHELSAYNKQVHFKEEVLSIPPVPYSFHSDISIPKDEAVMAALMKQADKVLSPTHLSTYINCSLQFYFQVIAGLTEVEEIEETIEASTLGTVIHDVLRKIYGQFIKAPVNSNELRKNVKDLENLVAKSFTEKYQEGDIYHGKNYLIFKVAEFLTGNMVNHEIEELEQGSQVFILNLEEFFDATLNIGKENDLTVRIKGKIDRVDRGDGAIRIIDYKSGFVGTSDLNVKEMQDLISDTKKAKALQLLVYSLLYHENNKSAGLPVSPGIYALRNPSRGLMPLRVEDQTSLTEDHFGQVRELLVELLRQIYNPEIPFTQTTIAENCTYCAFRMICNRNGGK